MPVRNIRDGELIVTDSNSKTTTLDLEDAGLSWDVTANVVNVLDRGALSHMRSGDEAPVTGSIGLKFVDFEGSDVTTPSLYEFLTRSGNASQASSTNDDGGDVYTTEVQFKIYDTADALRETITFAKVCPMGAISFAEGEEYDTINFAFQDFETSPTIVQA